jgi:hypothetical protein
MTIMFTRDKVLTLMAELPVNHWLQEDLMKELIQFNTDVELPTVPQRIVEQVQNVIYPGIEAKEGECAWECYGFVCKKDVVDATHFCADHVAKNCFCGRPATHGCNVELQFVCGGPLCNEHRCCAGH